ncbi:hypothetical protein COT72_02830 [archaeon CG10_big_fil_rev_8_21_14_0_10_43_11]|nr:MAG: hypothetical protein COT72_02830 [archaeon CG10_big_fil_rev_8_21_14_0_10_43_11]
MKDNSELFYAILAVLPLILSSIIVSGVILLLPLLAFYPFDSFFDVVFLAGAFIAYPVTWAFFALVMSCFVKRCLSKLVGPIKQGKNVAQELSFGLKMNIVFSHWILMLIAFSPFLSTSKSWVYRLAGMNLGKNVRIHGMISDIDFITIGDNCVLGYESLVVGHAFDVAQRVYSPVTIGNNCLIGARAVVFPGAVLDDDVKIGANAVVPKFAHLKARTIQVNQQRIIEK